VENEPSFLAYLLQQIGVPLFSLILVLVIGGSAAYFLRPWTGEQVANVVSCLAAAVSIGFLGGTAVSRLVPSARSSGRWVFVIPALAMLLGFLHDAFAFSLKDSFRELFFPGPNGEEWWAFFLLTCPTISALSYGAAMAWHGRLRTTK
jgi:hypothetical protein